MRDWLISSRSVRSATDALEMRTAICIALVVLLSGCVRREPEPLPASCRSVQSAHIPETPPVTEPEEPIPPCFAQLPAKVREQIIADLGGDPETELVHELGVDHLGRQLRLIQPMRYANDTLCAAIVCNTEAVGTLPSTMHKFAMYSSFELVTDGASATFLMDFGKVSSGPGYSRSASRVFRVERDGLKHVYTSPGAGYELDSFEGCFHRGFSTDPVISSWNPLIMSVKWELDLNEGKFTTRGHCEFEWNEYISEFYPASYGEYERMQGVLVDGPDGLISHYFPAFRQWAKEKGQPAKEWLRNLREGCELESSRVLIDMILG